MKLLKQEGTGRTFIYTESLAKRKDMVVVEAGQKKASQRSVKKPQPKKQESTQEKTGEE